MSDAVVFLLPFLAATLVPCCCGSRRRRPVESAQERLRVLAPDERSRPHQPSGIVRLDDTAVRDLTLARACD